VHQTQHHWPLVELRSPRTCTESYNGSAWTAGGALGAGRYSLAGAGTNTAALAFGGQLQQLVSQLVQNHITVLHGLLAVLWVI
jgi:hypothetical protein